MQACRGAWHEPPRDGVCPGREGKKQCPYLAPWPAGLQGGRVLAWLLEELGRMKAPRAGTPLGRRFVEGTGGAGLPGAEYASYKNNIEAYNPRTSPPSRVQACLKHGAAGGDGSIKRSAMPEMM